MMRHLALGLSTAAIFVTLNYMVVAKQRVVTTCDTVLLELAPVDPRSLMQGDYMRLDYQMSREARDARAKLAPTSPDLDVQGRLVITRDENNVGHFVRFDDGTPLANGEMFLAYRNAHSGVRLGAESYFFQEGQADLYQPAKYGELKVTPDGDSLLMGLCDEGRHPLGKRVSGL